MFALAMLACSDDSVASRLEGSWYGDSIENVDVAHLPSATGWVKATTLDFTDDTVTISIPAQLPRSGIYRVLQTELDNVTLQIQRRDGTLDLARFTVDDPRRLRWHLSNGRTIVMRRASH